MSNKTIPLTLNIFLYQAPALLPPGESIDFECTVKGQYWYSSANIIFSTYTKN